MNFPRIALSKKILRNRKKKIDTAARNRYTISCQLRQATDADLAQLVEQLIRNEQVVGSSPIISSIFRRFSSVGRAAHS